MKKELKKEQLSNSEWVTKMDEMIKDGADENARKQMLINLNYFLGNQWIGWDKVSKTIRVLENHDAQERITHNVIQPRVMTKLAKQTKNRIKYDVTPDTNEQARIEVAKGTTKFLHYWWDKTNADLKTRDIFLNNNVKAWCAAKVYFDTEAGSDITPSEGDPGYEEWKQAGERPLNTGEVKFDICDGLTIYIDPSATTEEEIRWIIEEKPKDIDYVFEKYGKQVTADETVSYASSFNLSEGMGESNKKNKNMVMVRELWYKPCKKYPKGLKVTTTRAEFLDSDDKPEDLPYIIFGDIPIPGSVKYKAFIESMLPIQRGLNIALTMFSTNMKKMGATKWAVPLGSGVDEEELNDEISGIIHYNPSGGGKVERIPGADVPNGFDRIIEYYNRLIDDMSGAREISQGSLPAGLDTASGLALMVEQENEKMAVNSQNYERGMKKVLKRVLQLMKKHYTEERLGRILGPDNEIELVSFTGSDLTGEEDINIVQGSSLPEMKSAQQDRIMSLWSANAIVNKEGMPDSSTFLKMMGMGDSTELFEQNQLDENKSKMENKTFLKMAEDPKAMMMVQQYSMEQQQYQAILQQAQTAGINPEAIPKPQGVQGAPIVRDFYDHEIHIYNHNVFRKSSDYEQLPPELQQMIDAHVAEHEASLQAPIIAQQQAEMAAQEGQESKDKESKEKEHQNNMEKESMKAQTSMQMAAMKTGVS